MQSHSYLQRALNLTFYFYNDKRAEIKRKINIHTNSDVVEEKQYTDYE